VTRAESVRVLVSRLHAAGDAPFVERDPGSGVYCWTTRLGRWPFEMQVDRYALMIRCYLADELLCTGRIPEEEIDALVEARAGGGDPAARAELTALVDAAVANDSRRFLTPPHADRHPDRRLEERHRATIEPKPKRGVDTPS